MVEDDDHAATRPVTRQQCAGGSRPCPWVSCRHHLGLRVTSIGEIRITFPDADGDGVDVEGMSETCALDLAERGPLDVVDVAAALGLPEHRVRAVEERAIVKLRAALPLKGHVL